MLGYASHAWAHKPRPTVLTDAQLKALLSKGLTVRITGADRPTTAARTGTAVYQEGGTVRFTESQLTPLKDACLRQCQSPLAFLMSRWRAGWHGGFVMGVQHGAYCVGCCWLLMKLLFVGGVMNLWWVVGIAVYVFLEKVVPAGPWLSRALGTALILTAVALGVPLVFSHT